jgi:hypothetical protein
VQIFHLIIPVSVHMVWISKSLDNLMSILKVKGFRIEILNISLSFLSFLPYLIRNALYLIEHAFQPNLHSSKYNYYSYIFTLFLLIWIILLVVWLIRFQNDYRFYDLIDVKQNRIIHVLKKQLLVYILK